MNYRIIILSGVALLSVATSLPAQAALLDFMLTGSREATFQLDSQAVPNTFSTTAFGDQIQFLNVAGTFGGIDETAPSIGFGSGLFATLNINGTSLGFTQFTGPVLFGGTAAAPIFSPGTFQLSSIVSGRSTLTISQAAPGASGAVPEPATWALMIGGFGLTGVALRVRRARMATSLRA